jgi:hypothetical protein
LSRWADFGPEVGQSTITPYPKDELVGWLQGAATYFSVLAVLEDEGVIPAWIFNSRRTCSRYRSSARRACSSCRIRYFSSSESSIGATHSNYRRGS